MYEIRNNRRRRTTIALPGRGIHLEPAGTKITNLDGSIVDAARAIITNEEFEDAAIQGKIRDKIIVASECEEPVGAKLSRNTTELRRIQSMRRVQERRAQQNEGPQAPAEGQQTEPSADTALGDRPRRRRREPEQSQEERKE